MDEEKYYKGGKKRKRPRYYSRVNLFTRVNEKTQKLQ